MTRWILIALTVLLAQGGGATDSSGPAAEAPADLPLHALTVEDMPESWRPHGSVSKSLDQSPWTAVELEEAARAVRTGLDELVEFFTEHPTSVYRLGTDAVESLIDVQYAGSNTPDLQKTAGEYARRNLTMLVNRRLQHADVPARCADYPRLVSLCNYAQVLYPESSEEKARLIELANAALDRCASSADYAEILADENLDSSKVFRLVIWAIKLIDAQTVPGLQIPESGKKLPAAIWEFVGRYPRVNARDYPEGAAAKPFIKSAYLTTHIAYMATGYGRHPIFIDDAPWLYRFVRENFYAVLEVGNLDLVAEFVDLLRHYGCTAETDLQTRDGTRYLMGLYHAAGDSWMNHREPGEAGREMKQYELIHKPWTGMAGVRRRLPKPPVEGSYGGIFREATGLK